MINLLNAELASLRYRARTGAAFIGLTLLGLLSPMMWMQSARPLSEAEKLDGERSFVEARAWCPECNPEDYIRQPWGFNQVIENGLQPLFIVSAVLVLVIVAFYVGSDFQSGALWTRLTFTPRRVPLLLARTLTSGLLGAAIMGLIAATATMVSAVWFVALRGFAELSTDERLLRSVAAAVLYGLIMGVVGCLATFMMNGTFGAGALILAVFVGSSLGDLLGYQTPRLLLALSPTRQAEAMLMGASTIWSPTGQQVVIDRPDSMLYHLIVVGLLFLVTARLFKRRDLKF